MLHFEEALTRLLEIAQPVAEQENLLLTEALGRVLAADQLARASSPPADNSEMDGYALRVDDLAAGKALPIHQRIAAGQSPQPLEPGTAARIFTGAPIPSGADAVVMQEQCELLDTPGGATQLSVNAEVEPGDHIRRAGEDISEGQCILKAGTRLRAQELGLAASGGLPNLPVFRRLRVAVFFTGDELIEPGETLPPGAIYNSNRSLLHGLLQAQACEVRDMGTVPDTLEATRAALRQAAVDSDLIITSGGVSVGEEDHVKPAVEAEGNISIWKIAIKPGKPLACGRVRRGKNHEDRTAFIGLPGNPVSAYVTFAMLVRPLIHKMQGMLVSANRYASPPFKLTMATPLKSGSRTEFVRVRLNEQGQLEGYINQGSGVLTSLAWGSGLALKPANTAIAAGEPLGYWPFTALV